MPSRKGVMIVLGKIICRLFGHKWISIKNNFALECKRCGKIIEEEW